MINLGLRNRTNPFVFRADGGLDFGPLVWAVSFFVGLGMFVADAFGVAHISVAAYAYLGAVTTITSIAGAAAERAYWIAQSNAPGAVARGIAESTPLDTDNGRDGTE